MPAGCDIRFSFFISLLPLPFITHRDDAFSSYTTYGFAISSAENTTAVVHGLLDSSLSGGTTPVQIVRTPLPAAARTENGQLKFDMQLFLDHSMTEVRVVLMLLTFSVELFGGCNKFLTRANRYTFPSALLQLYLEDGALAATMRIYPAEEQQRLAWFVSRPGSNGACEVNLDNIVVYSMGSIWMA